MSPTSLVEGKVYTNRGVQSDFCFIRESLGFLLATNNEGGKPLLPALSWSGACDLPSESIVTLMECAHQRVVYSECERKTSSDETGP